MDLIPVTIIDFLFIYLFLIWKIVVKDKNAIKKNTNHVPEIEPALSLNHRV